MGWIEKVRNIIDGLKKEGKSKSEIEQIVQQAADKATVTREVEQAMMTISDGVRKMGESDVKACESMDAFLYAAMVRRVCEERKNANNWRRMHGLPMRRKRRRKRRERGERAVNHPKNADVS